MINSSTHGHSEGLPPRPESPRGRTDLPTRPSERATPPPTPASQRSQSADNGVQAGDVDHNPGPPEPTDDEPETKPTTADESDQARLTNSGIVLDRSRARLRVPEVMLSECLRFSQALALSLSVGDSKTAGADKLRTEHSELVNRLRAARVLVDDQIDPIASELLNVCSQASLIIKVNLSFANESSASTVWATPREAVVSSSLDSNYAELRPVDVAHLPVVLSELMVLRRPRFVGQSPVSVGTKAVAEAETQLGDPDEAVATLVSAGLSSEQARLIIDFQGANVRRWRVSSTWSTDGGTESSELRGLDAGASGQWLVAMTGSRDEPGQMTFTPQGPGEVVRALRSVLPRSWVGTPLQRYSAE